jgi:rhamnogalacturonan endolyase
MGWSIETGIWYSPYLVYDLDGDARAEVYTKYIEGDQRDSDGHVRAEEEFVARLDGLTGNVTGKAPWPSRTGYVTNTDNHSNRNLMAIAYLDGIHPSLIVHRGIYDLVKSIAYDAGLKKRWYWDSGMEEKKYWHAGTHGLFPADVDGDGRDEIVYGSAVLDEYGKGLWTLEMGHCDFSYVGDILPSHPGYEIFYGFETWQDKNGIGLADAATGRFIWGYDAFVKHVHSQGMCADIIADHPGMELYGSQKNGEKTWLYDAQGNLLHDQRIDGLAPRAVRWDADVQQELILNNRIMAQGIREDGHVLSRIEGEIVAIADILGDWREEVITAVEGELRIYTTTVPADTRRVCLMQDRLYRNYVATASMGYFYPPIPGDQ